MKISTKGRYAIRVMLDLALNNTGECVRVREIAVRQNLSEKYLTQIIGMLNKAGYVRSTRGAKGGYRLAKLPEEYTVGMILRLTEGSINPVACLDTEANECKRCGICETLVVWEKLRDAINDVVDNVTLADLVRQHNEKAVKLFDSVPAGNEPDAVLARNVINLGSRRINVSLNHGCDGSVWA